MIEKWDGPDAMSMTDSDRATYPWSSGAGRNETWGRWGVWKEDKKDIRIWRQPQRFSRATRVPLLVNRARARASSPRAWAPGSLGTACCVQMQIPRTGTLSESSLSQPRLMAPVPPSAYSVTPWEISFLDPLRQSRNALIILNQPFTYPLLRRVWYSSSWHACADGGANRLHDLLQDCDGKDLRHL